MRSALAGAKSRLDELDKASKAATAGLVMEEAKQLCQSASGDFIVHVFNAGSNAKALNTALKEMEKSLPATGVMALSFDAESNKLVCLAQVPKVNVFNLPSFFLVYVVVLTSCLLGQIY